VGKVVLAFLFFIGASALAVREARPRRPPSPLLEPRLHPLPPPARATPDRLPASKMEPPLPVCRAFEMPLHATRLAAIRRPRTACHQYRVRQR
jgi:hypothetical protein